jgi:hypothetical protein
LSCEKASCQHNIRRLMIIKRLISFQLDNK